MISNIIIGVTSLACGFFIGAFLVSLLSVRALEEYRKQTGNDVIIFFKEHTDED